jgi:hypothetical protein
MAVTAGPEGRTMEPARAVVSHEAIDDEANVVHEWRTIQLTRLGIPRLMAEDAADAVDWHQIAALVRRGCPPELALRIVR